MRTQLALATAAVATMFTASALAADLAQPVYKAPPPPPIFTWTGFYIGIQGGYGSGTSEFSETSFTQCLVGSGCATTGGPSVGGSALASYGINGWHGGGTAGFNWQTGPVVVGVEGDISGANIDGRGDCTLAMSANSRFGNGAQTGCTTKLKSFATLDARLGVAVFDHALFYVKGGVAWGRFDHTATGAITAGFPVELCCVASVSETRTGATVGVGVEYAFWNNWSAKLEYDYMDFGTKSLSFVGAFVPNPAFTEFNNEDVRERVHVIRAGLNYRFNWWGAGPVYAKY